MSSTSKRSPSTLITRKPLIHFRKKPAFKALRTQIIFLFALSFFLPVTGAEPVLKIANGRVKEASPAKEELVLSYRHPVSGREEELVFRVDRETGFNRGLHFEDFKKGDPVSVDYEENPSGIPRARQVKRVAVNGVPDEIARFHL